MLRQVIVLFSCVAVFAYSTPKKIGFSIPQVKIEVFESRGFRVSIPHVDGMQYFAFHGTINRPMRNVEVGDYYQDVMEPINGRWVYEENNVKLKIGDRLYYWVYILHNKLGYRRDDQIYEVTGFHNKYTEHSDYPVVSFGVPDASNTPHQNSPKDTSKVPEDCSTCNESVNSCERTLLKITEKLVESEGQTDTVRKANVLLKNIINKLPDGKRLTMRGRLSREELPMTVVKFILNEKLGLRPIIVSARRNSDNSISFELDTVDDMLAVISLAKEKLENSKTVAIHY